jgi:restriction system protein
MLIAGVIVVALVVAGIVAYLMLRDPAAESPTNGNGRAPAEAHELLSLSWEEFEALLREAFERDGFRVFERQQGGAVGPAAGMADIVLDRKGKRWFVSAKYWRENTVPGHAVQ